MSNIPKGYKQSEVGVVPEDWEVKKLADISTEIGDGIHATPQYVDSSDYFFVNGHNLFNGRILITEETKCVSRQEYLSLSKRLSDRTILMSINGTIGNVAYFNNENIVLGKSVAYINLKGELRKSLIYYLLQHASIINYYENELTGTTIRNLSLKSIRETPIPLPPTKAEQTAIAATLSDADALINSLEKLIAKKRDIKRGAMQELLTGKKRLPGFSGAWAVKRIGEIAEIVSGGTPKTGIATYWEGGIKWCTPTDITNTHGKYLFETDRTISVIGLSSCSAHILPVGTLLLCSRATIGEVKIAASEVCTNQGFKSLICRPGVNNEFLYYLLLTMKHRIIEKSIGSTFLEISKKDTALLEVSLPMLAEQTAIAQILSDMDEEIEKLELKLAKHRVIKQGMTQELLTGKTRLI